jgi:hypothetical protein
VEDKEAEANRVNRALTKIAEREYNNRVHATRELCKTDWGRDFLWYLLRIGRIGVQPFAGEARSQTDFNCGELNVGQQILALIIEAEPSGYFRILEDQQNAERERQSVASGEQDVPGSDSDAA